MPAKWRSALFFADQVSEGIALIELRLASFKGNSRRRI
jgi:hypothetical protein